MVKVGDSIPSVQLEENKPGNKIDLSQTLKRGLIIGVPAAFSASPFTSHSCNIPSLSRLNLFPANHLLTATTGPGCSDTHLPEYIAHEKTKSAGDVYVVSVNDAFVMNAWSKAIDPDKSSGVCPPFPSHTHEKKAKD